MLVALVRNRGETLHQLLDRLERALGPAIEEGSTTAANLFGLLEGNASFRG